MCYTNPQTLDHVEACVQVAWRVSKAAATLKHARCDAATYFRVEGLGVRERALFRVCVRTGSWLGPPQGKQVASLDLAQAQAPLQRERACVRERALFRVYMRTATLKHARCDAATYFSV